MVTGTPLQFTSRGMRALRLFAYAVAMLSLPVSGLAADTAKRYALAGHGYFQLSVPAGWTEQVDQKSQPLLISFAPDKGAPFIVSITPAREISADKSALTRDGVRAEVVKMAEGIRLFAVEKDLKVVEFAGAAGPGFYFFATDSAPASGGYKFMHRGMLKVGDLAVTFTVLTNAGQDAIVRAALDMLKSAAHVPR